MSTPIVPSLEFRSLHLAGSRPGTAVAPPHPPHTPAGAQSARKTNSARPKSSHAYKPKQIQLAMVPQPPTQASEVVPPQPTIRSMLTSTHIPRSTAQKYQTYDSPCQKPRQHCYACLPSFLYIRLSLFFSCYLVCLQPVDFARWISWFDRSVWTHIEHTGRHRPSTSQ